MPQRCLTTPLDIRVHGRVPMEAEHILSPDALRFLGYLHTRYEQRRQMLLAARVARQCEFDAGIDPCFRAETKYIRDDPAWSVRPPPKDLEDRRVEITGPVDRKMVINGLNSGASTYMADFEDSTSPTWDNVLDGQVNLYDATRGTIEYTNPANGKVYKVNEKHSVLLVRPRGWHLDEAHVT
ncbi:malate synthase, partial [Tribonema minus]